MYLLTYLCICVSKHMYDTMVFVKLMILSVHSLLRHRTVYDKHFLSFSIFNYCFTVLLYYCIYVYIICRIFYNIKYCFHMKKGEEKALNSAIENVRLRPIVCGRWAYRRLIPSLCRSSLRGARIPVAQRFVERRAPKIDPRPTSGPLGAPKLWGRRGSRGRRRPPRSRVGPCAVLARFPCQARSQAAGIPAEAAIDRQLRFFLSFLSLKKKEKKEKKEMKEKKEI